MAATEYGSEALLLRRTQTNASQMEAEPVGAMRAEIERAFSPLETSPLRRTTLTAAEIAAKIEIEAPVSPQAQHDPVPDEAPQRRPSAGPDTPVAPRADISFAPKQPERRKADRRGMDALRDDALRTLISKVEDKNFGGLRNQVHWSRGINRTRLVLILVAVLAGGLAAFLATREYAPAAIPVAAPVVTTEVVAEPRTQILVAKEPIAVGERLTAGLIAWEDWPASAVRAEYITNEASPDALTDMADSAARVQFFPGEPIRAQKLAEAGQGFLASMLESGMRGVSVSVGAESASGGFIVPGDRVDVVLTRTGTIGQVSDTILHNVRVLAVNEQTAAGGTVEAPASESPGPRPEVFKTAIATLELDPNQAEVIINATTTGTLSLVLRPTMDVAEAGTEEQRATNQAIRISSPFWAK